MNFSDAHDRWRLRQQLTIELHEVTHSQLSEFSRSCQRLLAQVQVAYGDDLFWRKYASALKRIRYDLAANPVSFDTASFEAPNVIRRVRHSLNRRRKIYPDVTEDAIALLDTAEFLVTSNDSPLLDHLYYRELLVVNDDTRVGLVVRESRYLPGLQDQLTVLDSDAVSILVPNHLKTCGSFERLIFIGPTVWFPDYVVASPRAPHLLFVRFAWLGPDCPPRSLHPGVRGRNWETHGFPKPYTRSNPGNDGAQQSLLDIVPDIDWGLVLDKHISKGDGESDVVLARLCLLEGDVSVFLRGHNGARTSVLSINHMETDVCRELVEDLEPGDFLLLRTAGGGDYVAEVAWRYLGDKANLVQVAQAHWKQKLAEAIAARGAGSVSRNCTISGAKAASRSNIIAWASEERIQPREKGDFIALLKMLGLGNKADEYWTNGRAIFRARIKAGHRIRELLLEQIREANIAALEERGRADFQLPERHGGTITAIRLRSLAPFVSDVPVHRIGVLDRSPTV